jgi:Zn-finger in ubiquitin-hydrolases and other protein
MTSTTFSLHVKLGNGCDDPTQQNLNKACNVNSPQGTLGNLSASFFGSSAGDARIRFFVASASHVDLSVDERKQSTSLVAILTPPHLIDECLVKYTSTKERLASGSCFWVTDSSANMMSQDLLSRIHWSVQNGLVRGIVRTSISTAENNAPAEFLLLELPPNDQAVGSVLEFANGQAFNADSTAVLKILPVSTVQFQVPGQSAGKSATPSSHTFPTPPVIPACPVCLHRIDPIRLGQPQPEKEHICSKFCPPPNLVRWATELGQSCPRQRFLRPWGRGARCQACRVIQQYWNHNSNINYVVDDAIEEEATISLFCLRCAMHKTLWVCLTCGFVGCGRYSNRHSVQHFQETQHPYSLELATLRIWDYVHEDRFAHRVDLLECPSCPPLTHPWISRDRMSSSCRSAEGASAVVDVPPSASVHQEKSPKKATMISEEYEILLQSALEDQAQHYEVEISRVRAQLSETLVDQTTLTGGEYSEMEDLKGEIGDLHTSIAAATHELLRIQTKEAILRAKSQRLLKEQQEANGLLKTLENEARQEAQRGKLQINDLEQQVQDLTTNLRMREQFSESEELSQAQIFGTCDLVSTGRRSGKEGKKKGRLYRK